MTDDWEFQPSPKQRQWALERIAQRTEANPDGIQDVESNVWTALDRLKGDASKTDLIERYQVKPLVYRLGSEDKIVHWHGLLAPATDTHLRAIIANEHESGMARKLLVARCNALLQQRREKVTP